MYVLHYKLSKNILNRSEEEEKHTSVIHLFSLGVIQWV